MRSKAKRRAWVIVLATVMFTPALRFVQAARKPGASEIRSAQNKTASVIRQLDAANGLLQRGFCDLAQTEYRGVLAADADAGTQQSAQYGLAVCLFRLEKYADAAEALEPLVVVDDFEYGAEVGVMLGRSLAALDRNGAAIVAFDAVAQRFPKHALSQTASAGAIDALYRSGDHAEVLKRALRVLRRLENGPLRHRVLYLQALAELNAEDHASAAAHFAELLGLEPDAALGAQARLMLGHCAVRRSAYADAISWFEAVITDGPEALHAEASLALADAYYRLGDAQQAEAAAARVLGVAADQALTAQALFLKGRVRFDAGEYVEARDMFEQALDHDGVDAGELGYWIAKCALRMDAACEAADSFEQLHADHPNGVMVAEAEYDRAVALIACERLADATRVLREFRRRFAKHALAPGALHLLAVVAQRGGDYEACNSRAGEFLKNHADHPQVADVLLIAGQCAYHAENWEDASKKFEEFIKRFADDARVREAIYRAGLAAHLLERFNDAERLFARLLTGDTVTEQHAPAALALGDICFQRGDWEKADRWLTLYLAHAAAPESGDDALLKRGMARRRLDRRRAALTDFETLLAQWPKSPHRSRALLECGEVLTQLGERGAAEKAFAAVADASHKTGHSSLATYQRAVLAMQTGDYAVAAEHLTRVLDAKQTDERAAEALYQRGQCRLALGDYDAALTDFASLRKNFRSHDRAAGAQAWKVVALARQDKPAEALAALSQLSEKARHAFDARTRAVVTQEQAWALRRTGETDSAADAYNTLLALPDVDADTRAHAQLAVAEINIEREGCDAAIDRLRALCRDAGADRAIPAVVRERALYRVGLCAIQSQRWKEAAETFSALLNEFPESTYGAAASLYLGEAAAQRGRHGEAQAHLERVTGDCTSDALCALALLRLGEALAAQQQWARSERALADYLTRYGEEQSWYQAQFGVGWAREHLQRHDDAIAAYREVVARHQGPTAARAQFQIGECLFAQGSHEAAARALLKVDILYDYPEWSAAALYEAGRCFEQLGRRVDARRQFEAVVERFGESQWARTAAERLPRLTASAVPGH